MICYISISAPSPVLWYLLCHSRSSMRLPGYLLSLPVVLSVLAWMSAVVSLNELRAGPRFRRGREGLKGACSDGKVSPMSKLALFPGCSHLLQSLIACSMQMLRGKAWEVWSCAVISGLTHGRWWCLTKNLETLSCSDSLRAGNQSIHKAASIPFVTRDVRDRSMQTEIITVGHCPLCVHLMSLHVTKSPRQLGTACEQDYVQVLPYFTI